MADDWVFRDEDSLVLAKSSVKGYVRQENGRPEQVRPYQRGMWWIPHPQWEQGKKTWITAGEAAWRERGAAADAKEDAADEAAEPKTAEGKPGTAVARRGGDGSAEGVVGKGTMYERPVHGYERPDPERLVREKGTYKRPEQHPFFQQVPMSKENIKSAYRKTTSAEKYQGRRWYPDMARLAWALGGGDPELGAKVLSSYSPRTGWPLNMFNAARALANGKPLEKGEGIFMPTHTQMATAALAGKDLDEVFKGPKTNAFARLGAYGLDHPDDPLGLVVVDTHALSVAAGRRLTKEEGDKAPIGKDPFYSYVADMYRHAAADLSEETGEEISPAELQAMTWLRQQRMNEEEDQGLAEAGDKAAKGRLALGRAMKTHWRNWEKYAREHGIDTVLGTTALPPVPVTEAEARGDSLPVSAAEFHATATRGRDLLNNMESDTSPLTGMVASWDSLKSQAWAAVQQPDGGLTIDAHTGEPLASGADKYALSVKPPGVGILSVPDDATQKQFNAVLDEALVKFRAILEQSGYYLGVFHDSANHRIDIDPVAVVSSLADAQAIMAYTHGTGGAFHFASSQAFYPPHIAE